MHDPFAKINSAKFTVFLTCQLKNFFKLKFIPAKIYVLSSMNIGGMVDCRVRNEKCMIGDTLRDLVAFVQFKKREKHP